MFYYVYNDMRKHMTYENASLSAGKYIENHGVIHNMWFNSSTWEKKSYYKSQFVNEWWDNGSLPIWITAQRQVRMSAAQKKGLQDWSQ